MVGVGKGKKHLHKQKCMPAFRYMIGRVSVGSQLPSAQNNPYVQVAYLGVTYPDVLRLHTAPYNS